MLSTEQAAARDFYDASRFLRDIADDGQGRALVDFTEAFISAVNAFGQAELTARRDDRFKAVGVKADAGSARQRVKANNQRGLRALAVAEDALERFRGEVASYPADAKAEGVDVTLREVREQLAELDLKASDVEKIDAAIVAGFEITKDGPTAVPDYLAKQLAELDRVRRRADRGAVDNIAVWKIIAIAVAVGVWIWAFFRCGIFRGCSMAEGLAYFIVFWLAVLIARFC